jgi:hypothetical protein
LLLLLVLLALLLWLFALCVGELSMAEVGPNTS